MMTTKGGSKVQSCDATSSELIAYKGTPFEKNVKIELLQYYIAVVQFFCCADQWYITVYCYKIHKIKTKIN